MWFRRTERVWCHGTVARISSRYKNRCPTIRRCLKTVRNWRKKTKMTPTKKTTFDWWMAIYANKLLNNLLAARIHELMNLRRMFIRNTTTKARIRSLFWFFNLFTSLLGFYASFPSAVASYLGYFSISTAFPATILRETSISFIVNYAPSTISASPFDFKIALKLGSFTKNSPPIISSFTPAPSL